MYNNKQNEWSEVMNILYKMVDPDNIFGFNYILENKDYYIDISCENYENSDWIRNIYVNEKTHPEDDDMIERQIVLGESYEVVMVTNKDIKLIKNCRISYYSEN